MFTIIFTLFLANVVRNNFLNTVGGKANIGIEYIETKWYIKPKKFGSYRVVKTISDIVQQGLI